jgi:Ni/Co efflux regulator RcnB
MFESKTIVAIAAGALLLASPALAQQTQTTKKSEEKTVSTTGEMDKTTETTVKSPAGKTKATSHTVIGTVKEFEAGKSIKIATSKKKSQKFALDAKNVATTVDPDVAVGVKVKAVQATDKAGIKSLTISKA